MSSSSNNNNGSSCSSSSGGRVLVCAALAAACTVGPTAATSSTSIGIGSASHHTVPLLPRSINSTKRTVDSFHIAALLSLNRGGGSGGDAGGGGGDVDDGVGSASGDSDATKSKNKSKSKNKNKKKQNRTPRKESTREERQDSANNDRTSQPPQEENTHNSTPTKKKDGWNSVATAIMKEDNYYAVLGLSSSSSSSSPSSPSSPNYISQTQITKAYRRRCVLTHPDKMPGGDRRAFDKVSEAYDVLRDDTKRKVYDRFGVEGLKNPHLSASTNQMGTGMGGLQDQILKSFFGSASPFSQFPPSHHHPHQRHHHQQRRFEPRNDDVKYTLQVTLEDLYNGTNYPILLSQTRKKIDVAIPGGPVPVLVRTMVMYSVSRCRFIFWRDGLHFGGF